MKNKYEQIMDRVEVTEEMKSRILSNIREQMKNEDILGTDIEKDGIKEDPAVEKKSSNKIIRFANWRRYSTVAAAVFVLIIGAFAYFNHINKQTPGDEVLLGTGFVEVASLEELEQTVGYDMEELENIPVDVEDRSYLVYNGEDAEIQYIIGNQQRITYSKFKEIDVDYGHYETYEVTKKVEVTGASETGEQRDPFTVTIKGSSEGYQMAVWDDGTYGYMIYSDIPLTEEQLLEMIPE